MNTVAHMLTCFDKALTAAACYNNTVMMTYYHELTFCSTYKKYSIAIVIEYVPKKEQK